MSGDLRAEVRAAAPVGSSRAQLYAVLRERRLLGFNYALRHFDISRSGGLADADHGEWPHPGQTPQPIADPRFRAFVARERRSLDTAHPFVDVIDTWDLQGFSCTTRARQRFFFDAYDRVSRVEESAPVRACD